MSLVATILYTIVLILNIKTVLVEQTVNQVGQHIFESSVSNYNSTDCLNYISL